jgi:hypothetical protein
MNRSGRLSNEKTMLIFLSSLVLLINSESTDNETSSSSTTSLPITTTLNPWDQAYIEIFGHLPIAQGAQSASISPIMSTTTQTVEVNRPTPSLSYQTGNSTKPTLFCRDKAKNCGEIRTMCRDKLYNAALAEMCAFSCDKCGPCVDQTPR